MSENTPPRGSAKWDLVTVGETAREAVDIGLENRAELRAMRTELQTAIRPIRRAWYVDAAVVIMALCAVVLVAVFLRREREAQAGAVGRPDVVIVRGEP